jgi:peptide/nickel transport system permease protein
LVTVKNPQSKETEWWAEVNGQLIRWKMEKCELMELRRQTDGSIRAFPTSGNWQQDEKGQEYFWGVDTRNNVVKWVRGAGVAVWVRSHAGFRREGDGPQEYIPLRKGLVRGDPGTSLQYGRPVATILLPRIRNTLVLAGVAFSVVMPLALFLGILAGINEGKPLDRFISISSLGATATPEFVTGIFLILIFGIWLRVLPAVAIFTSDNAIFENPTLLALPVLTLTAVELGYIARMTRASMVEVMDSAYIRTAIVKGMPYWRVVLRHAIRNALMAPITVIMLHVNWLIGNVVVVEVIFGYPGLGKYIYDAAIFGDYNAIEAAAMVTVAIAIITRLIGDLAYTLLNPRVRYT